MRVLVTGASGFIGSHVARRLVTLGQDVVATGRSSARLHGLADTRCALRVTDLSKDMLDPLLEGCEAIVHCAARASPWGKRSLYWIDNVLATERLVDAARRAGSIRRFVLISSPSIYFRACDQLSLTEEFSPPKRWVTAYAETKWLAERRVLAAPELGPVVLRPRAVFGSRDRAIVPRIIAVARTGLFPLPGGGAAWTDVTYVDNVVAATILALQGGPNIEGQCFNITNGEPIRIRELLQQLLAALQIHTRFIPLPRGLAWALAGGNERIAQLFRFEREPRLTRYSVGLLGYSQTLSIAAAQRELGYRPTVSVREGLELYAHWWHTQA